MRGQTAPEHGTGRQEAWWGREGRRPWKKGVQILPTGIKEPPNISKKGYLITKIYILQRSFWYP